MDFSLTAEQQGVYDRMVEFGRTRLASDVVARDHAGAVDPADWRDLWRVCAEYGVLGVQAPKAYGGMGYDVQTAALAMEAFGHGCDDNGLALGLNGQIWVIQTPILEFGTEAQKQRYLPKLIGGEMVASHAVTEAASGSDAGGLAMTAERRGDGYVLNGEKTMIGMAPACDLALVFAKTAPDMGTWGISAFLVEATTPGFRRGAQQQKMGMRTTPLGRLHLEDCFVPESARLGAEGAGAGIFAATAEWERRFVLASHVGAMRRQLDQCLAYSRDREVFGGPIADKQSVANRLVDMEMRYETAKLMLRRAAWQMDAGVKDPRAAAMTKLHISEAFVASSMDAIRTFGGMGYLSEAGVERDLRDAVGGVIYGGTSDIQRHIIARMQQAG